MPDWPVGSFASPASTAARSLWIGAVQPRDDGTAFASVVMLRGVRDLASLDGLARHLANIPARRS